MRRKEKSLRQLARGIGVSHSYLSQVKHGKRPASTKLGIALHKVVSDSCVSGKQNINQYDRILGHFTPGGVSELADEHDLGSCAARRGGSSPPFPIRPRTGGFACVPKISSQARS